MTSTSYTSAGIAYDRAGPRGDLPVVLIHAGVADRRMWDPLWLPLTAERDVIRLDLRGFGESVTRPRGLLCPADDVLDTLTEVGIDSSHLVGASFGAGVAVEVALTRPEMVASLLLSAPGGSLIAEAAAGLRGDGRLGRHPGERTRPTRTRATCRYPGAHVGPAWRPRSRRDPRRGTAHI